MTTFIPADPLHANRAFLTLQRSGASSSELCLLTLQDILFKLALVARSGEVEHCQAIDGPPVKGVALAPYSVLRFPEGRLFVEAFEGEPAEVEVERAGDLRSSLSARWQTTSSKKILAGLHGTLAFGPGQRFASIHVPIPDDHRVQPPRTLSMQLEASPSSEGEWVTGSPDSASVRVKDNDLRMRWTGRRSIGLQRVLRRRRLAIPYVCSYRCGFVATLYGAGQGSSKLSESIRREKSRRGSIVFKLDRAALRALRHSAIRATPSLSVWASFHAHNVRGGVAKHIRLRLKP